MWNNYDMTYVIRSCSLFWLRLFVWVFVWLLYDSERLCVLPCLWGDRLMSTQSHWCFEVNMSQWARNSAQCQVKRAGPFPRDWDLKSPLPHSLLRRNVGSDVNIADSHQECAYMMLSWLCSMLHGLQKLPCKLFARPQHQHVPKPDTVWDTGFMDAISEISALLTPGQMGLRALSWVWWERELHWYQAPQLSLCFWEVLPTWWEHCDDRSRASVFQAGLDQAGPDMSIWTWLRFELFWAPSFDRVEKITFTSFGWVLLSFRAGCLLGFGLSAILLE